MADTGIAWCDRVWNPVTGCSKVSAGCKHCYAERMAKRLAGRFGYPADKPFAVTLHWDRLEMPALWTKPRRVFVNSMSDLFHKDVPDHFIKAVWAVMGANSEHTFQVLTKRPERMRAWCEAYYPDPLPNVWLGTSVENQEAANERIPHLLETPAAVRWISAEPLLGPIDIRPYLWDVLVDSPDDGPHFVNRLDWVVVGCESGPGARPMDLDWARAIRDACDEAGIAYFLKQAMVDGVKVETPELDGVRHTEYPS